MDEKQSDNFYTDSAVSISEYFGLGPVSYIN
jgi:hypothetical protein